MKEIYEDRKPARQTQPAAQIEIVTECKKQSETHTYSKTQTNSQIQRQREREREREREG